MIRGTSQPDTNCDEVNLQLFFGLIWRNKHLLIAALTGTILLAVSYKLWLAPQTYTAVGLVQVNVDYGLRPENDQPNSTLGFRSASEYRELMLSSVTAEPVAEAASAKAPIIKADVEQLRDTNLLRLSITSRSKTDCVLLGNAWLAEFRRVNGEDMARRFETQLELLHARLTGLKQALDLEGDQTTLVTTQSITSRNASEVLGLIAENLAETKKVEALRRKAEAHTLDDVAVVSPFAMTTERRHVIGFSIISGIAALGLCIAFVIVSEALRSSQSKTPLR